MVEEKLYRNVSRYSKRDLNNIGEERIVRGMIHKLFEQIPYDDLKEIFSLEKRKDKLPQFDLFNPEDEIVELEIHKVL